LDTVALIPPKFTIFKEGVLLKPVPDITTLVPTGPLAGARVEITGWDIAPRHMNKVVYRKKTKFLIKEFAT
jgi:hypothetical protein